MTATVERPSLWRVAGGAGARLEWTMWVLVAVAAGYTVTAAYDLAQVRQVVAALPSPRTAPLEAGLRFGTAEMVLFWVLFVAVNVWLRLLAVAVQRVDGDSAPIVRSAPVVLWRIGAVVTVAAAFALPRANLFDPERFGLRLRWMEPVLAARLALTAILIWALVVLRRRVYAFLLHCGVPPLPRRPAAGATSLADIAKLPMIVPPLPPPSDDDEPVDRPAGAG